jgi:hypothetical protein
MSDTRYFPLPHGTPDPYLGIACDDIRFGEAVAYSNRVWQDHQIAMRKLLGKPADKTAPSPGSVVF